MTLQRLNQELRGKGSRSVGETAAWRGQRGRKPGAWPSHLKRYSPELNNIVFFKHIWCWFLSLN